MTMMRNNRILIALAVVAITAAACGGGEQAGNGAKPQETALAGTATITIDAEIEPLFKAAKAAYDKDYPNAHITFAPESGRQALADLFRLETRACIVARDLLPDEDSAQDVGRTSSFPRTLIARDALVFFAAKSYPSDTLNAEHIRTWLEGGQVDMDQYPKGTPAPTFIVPGAGSSVYGNIMKLVTNGKKPRGRLASIEPKVPSQSSFEFVRERIRASKDLIGVGLLSQLVHDTSVKMLRIGYTDTNGVTVSPKPVHQGWLVQGLYPYPVPVYIYLKDPPSQYSLPSGFAVYLSRDAKAQRTFGEAGIEPGHMKIVLVPEE